MNIVRFQTTPEQIVKLPEIMAAMLTIGFAFQFVAECAGVALVCQGTFELLEQWYQATDQEEKDACMDYVHDALDCWFEAKS